MKILSLLHALLLLILIQIYLCQDESQDQLDNQDDFQQKEDTYQNNLNEENEDDSYNHLDQDDEDQSNYQQDYENNQKSDTSIIKNKAKHLQEFNDIDTNQDGRLDLDEIKQNVEGATQKELNDLMLEADKDFSGTLDFDEYFTLAQDVEENYDEELERQEELYEQATQHDEEMEEFYRNNKHLFGDRKTDM